MEHLIKKLFKTNVPFMSYEDVKSYIDRVANGEPSDVLSALPITGFLLSSGTSGGKQKILPLNDKYLENMRFIYDLCSLVIFKHVGGVEQGKGMIKYFRNRHHTGIIPTQVPMKSFGIQTKNGVCCCHLLCGLVQRDDVVRVGAIFSPVLIRALNFLENFWKEFCTNIRSGQVSDWITDLSCKASVSMILLGGPNPKFADFIEQTCSQKSWQGIIRQLWPNAKFIDESIFTGQMAQYIPTVEFYSNKLPLITTAYASSETFFGINVNPLSKPQDVSYTFMSNIA